MSHVHFVQCPWPTTFFPTQTHVIALTWTPPVQDKYVGLRPLLQIGCRSQGLVFIYGFSISFFLQGAVYGQENMGILQETKTAIFSKKSN